MDFTPLGFLVVINMSMKLMTEMIDELIRKNNKYEDRHGHEEMTILEIY